MKRRCIWDLFWLTPGCLVKWCYPYFGPVCILDDTRILIDFCLVYNLSYHLTVHIYLTCETLLSQIFLIAESYRTTLFQTKLGGYVLMWLFVNPFKMNSTENSTRAVHLLSYLIDYIDLCKYILILNLKVKNSSKNTCLGHSSGDRW